MTPPDSLYGLAVMPILYRCLTPSAPQIMAQLPLTESFFSTENENNIIVAQEEARPHAETDQLVSSTHHMPRWRRDDGEMLCVLLAPSPVDTAPNTQHLLPHTLMREQRRVLLEDMLPLPSQDTTHQGGGLDLLGIGNMVTPRSGVGNSFEASDTNEHATSHHTLQPPPSAVMTVHNTPVTLYTTSHLCCECFIEKEVECTSKRGVPGEAEGDPPPTQQLVSGW